VIVALGGFDGRGLGPIHWAFTDAKIDRFRETKEAKEAFVEQQDTQSPRRRQNSRPCARVMLVFSKSW
jgi:hypothetical protein